MDIFERIKKDSGGSLGQYRKKAHGYFMFPKLEGEIAPLYYDKNSKGVRYAIQEGCEGNEGNRKLTSYFASGKECVFNMPVVIDETTSLESEAGKPYVIQVRDSGGYISTVKVVYTKTKP